MAAGVETLGFRDLWVEQSIRWETDRLGNSMTVSTWTTQVQKEDAFVPVGLSLRFRATSRVLHDRFYVGAEVGAGGRSGVSARTWDIPAQSSAPGTVSLITTDQSRSWPSTGRTTHVEQSLSAFWYPIMGRLEWNLASAKYSRLTAGAAIGRYIVDIVYSRTGTDTYLADSPPDIRSGDIQKTEYRWHKTLFPWAGEVNLVWATRFLGRTIGIEGGLSLISEETVGNTTSGLRRSEPGGPETLKTLTRGVRVGGVGWGARALFTF